MGSYEKILNLVRLALGWIFLWTFLDKLVGLGFSTPADKGWLDGTSPTAGFLSFGTEGPLAETFKALSGNPGIDWLYMLGMLLVGTALLLGIATRLAAIGGIAMMALIYLSVFPPEHNPLIDEHIIYILILLALSLMPGVGTWLGIGRWWQSTRLVQKYTLFR